MSGADSTVELVPYDPRWPERFAAAAEQLRRVFPSAQIEHIGSTSVVGLSSKDTVDIAVGVPGVAECLTGDVLAALAELGFSFVPASFADDPDHAFLARIVRGHRTDHLHVMRRDVEPMIGHLLFRDYLRDRPDVAARYEQAKQDLARLHRLVRDEYVRQKQPVVQAILDDARRQAAGRVGDPSGPARPTEEAHP